MANNYFSQIHQIIHHARHYNLLMIELASSIVSSTVSTCIVYPAERTKLEMHLHHDIKSTKEAVEKIYEKYGLKGFYMGLNSQIFGNGLSYAIYFVAYAQAKKLFNFDPNSLASMIKSSGAAGCVATIATNPFWVLKTKQAHKNVSILEAGKELVLSQGVLALWKGLVASLMLVSNPIIQFCVYEWLKKKNFVLKHQKTPIYFVLIFIVGAVSKIIATIFTYPYTLVRTKQHINKDKKNTLWRTFVTQLEKNGVKGLYTGMNAKIFQSVLNSAILLMVYERTHLAISSLLKK